MMIKGTFSLCLSFWLHLLNSFKHCHTRTKCLLVCGNVVLIHLPITSSEGLQLQNGRWVAWYVVNNILSYPLSYKSNSFDWLSHCLAVHTNFSAILLLWEKYRLLVLYLIPNSVVYGLWTIISTEDFQYAKRGEYWFEGWNDSSRCCWLKLNYLRKSREILND